MENYWRSFFRFRTFFSITVLTELFIVICILWIDYPLAALLSRLPMHHGIRITKVQIPDLLYPGSLLLVAVALTWYYFCIVTDRFSSTRSLARSISIVMPSIYFVKELLQHFFGRVYPRDMLLNPHLQEFRFFHENIIRGGFPSGHMMVITPLLFILCRFSPALRPLWYGTGIALGTALVITNYHFLGDVIAGALAGFVADHMWVMMSGQSMTKKP